jgi:hypothetical protein
MFQLTASEKAEVVAICDHLSKLKFSRVLPFAFTEHGAIQAANVLASAQAVEMGIYVVRAFVQLRQASLVHADLDKRLTELQERTERLELSHDTFSRNTRAQLRQMFEALRQLMAPPDPPKRPIGFVYPKEQDKPKDKGKAGREGWLTQHMTALAVERKMDGFVLIKERFASLLHDISLWNPLVDTRLFGPQLLDTQTLMLPSQSVDDR